MLSITSASHKPEGFSLSTIRTKLKYLYLITRLNILKDNKTKIFGLIALGSRAETDRERRQRQER